MISVRAPDHLGDGVMARPAIEALARVQPVEVHAPGWGPDLYGDIGIARAAEAVPRGELGVILKPSLGAAWRWRHLPRRVGLATNGRGALLTDAVPVREEHRREGFARVAAALGAVVEEPSRYVRRGVAPEVPIGHVGLNAWSPTATVRWEGFRELGERLTSAGAQVVWYAGPGEGREVAGIATGPVVAGLSLPDFAAALDRCRVFVSNDSGAAHFAAACGVRVVMVHGSTRPDVTGVGEAVTGGPIWCGPCYRKWCFNGLKCLKSVSVPAVEARI